MKNHKLLLLTSILSTMILSSCIGERLISVSKNFYSKNNDMLCVNHSAAVKTGRIHAMGEDITIKLQRESPTTSCALFEIRENKITTKTIDNRYINIYPYKYYYFNSNIYRENGEATKQSGAGPNVCFIKINGNFVLYVRNAFDIKNRNPDPGCS